MPLQSNEWSAIIGVFVVILAMIGYNHFVAKRDGPSGPKRKEGDGPSVDPMLSRFVVHGGDVVGEVLAIEGDTLIVKQAGVFRAIPRALATLHEDEVHLAGEMDLGTWEAAGAAWLEANRKGQDDAVSPQLTTSADVKKPALEAFKERQEELHGDGEEE